jgi:hypothetical protein
MAPVNIAFDIHNPESFVHNDNDRAMLEKSGLEAIIYNAAEWDSNFQVNMRRFKRRLISEEFEKHEGPVLVVGAGPSLVKLPQLINEMPEAKIVAVDRAVDTMAEMGIAPDWIVSRDSSEKVKAFFCDTPVESKVILSIFTHPDVAEEVYFTNDVYWYGPIPIFNMFYQHIVEEHGIEMATNLECGTVGAISVDIATRMGFNPVIAIGQDYCFTDYTQLVESGYERKDMQEKFGLLTIVEFYCDAVMLGGYNGIYPDVEYLDASGGLLSKFWKSYEWRH